MFQMPGQTATTPIQLLLRQMQQQQIKSAIDKQYLMQDAERMKREKLDLLASAQLEKEGKARTQSAVFERGYQIEHGKVGRPNPKDIEKTKHTTSVQPIPANVPQVPKPEPPPQKVIPPPAANYVVAKDMQDFRDLRQQEMEKAQRENREPDFDFIKKPNYKPPKITPEPIDIHRYVNNPNYDPTYAGKLMNQKEYSEAMYKKGGTSDIYPVYVKKWQQRHKFLAPNPQYQQVEYLLKKKQEQQEKTFTIRNSDAYKRGQIQLEQTKKEFGKPPPMIKLGRENLGGGGYTTDI